MSKLIRFDADFHSLLLSEICVSKGFQLFEEFVRILSANNTQIT